MLIQREFCVWCEQNYQQLCEWTCEGNPKFIKVGVDGYLSVIEGAYVST